jgi:peptide/nickel transport system substrate-binding protein/oligopeptide transport system substrate-binding protein
MLVRLSDDEVKSLDPQAVSDLASLRVAADQFEGLTRFNGFGQVEPALAENWQVNSNGLVWRFVLRPRMLFSDGKPINAETIAQSFSRLRATETASPVKSLFDSIELVRANGNDVVVTLRHPFPSLPELLAHPALAALPLHRKKWTTERPVVTSGAYRLKEWVLNDHILLERNLAWHSGRAPVEQIRWQPVSDSLTALRQFQSSGADTTSDFPSSRLQILRKRTSKSVHVAPYNGCYYFVFNTRKLPFRDARVRRALNITVDRGWIAGKLLGLGARPAYSVVPPHVGEILAYIPYWAMQSREANLEKARALLAAAGYGPKHKLNFDIRFNSDADHRRIAVALAVMWRPLGVEAHLLNTEASLHFSSLRRGDFLLARSGWIGDLAAPENYLSLYRSDAGSTNYSGYSNPTFDLALENAAKLTDNHLRARAFRKAEALIEADSPVIPLYYYVSKSLVADRVIGWHDNPSNIHPSWTLSLKL